jgi:hypothetical protein
MGRYFLLYFRRESSYFTEGCRSMKEMSIPATACILYIPQYHAINHVLLSLSVSKGNVENSSTLLKMMKLNSSAAV